MSPVACEADNRIKDAGTRRKQEGVQNRLRRLVQPIDFPLKSVPEWLSFGTKINPRPFLNRTTERARPARTLRVASIVSDAGRHLLTRAGSRMVAMHPATLMKSEIECL
jgi:hypothetical protein